MNPETERNTESIDTEAMCDVTPAEAAQGQGSETQEAASSQHEKLPEAEMGGIELPNVQASEEGGENDQHSQCSPGEDSRSEKESAEEREKEGEKESKTGSQKEGERERLPSVWPRAMSMLLLSAFCLLLALGAALPLRPEYSESEKRSLRSVPALTGKALLSGEYFSELSLWFSDTFPFRERLLSGGAALEGLYGLQGEAVYARGGSRQKEAIPELASEAAPTMSPDDWGAEKAGEASAENAGAETGAAAGYGQQADGSGESGSGQTEQDNEVFETDAAGNLLLPRENTEEIELQGEQAGSIYVNGSRAYELYYFGQKNMTAYASMLNTVKGLLPDTEVYAMIVPNSFGIELEPALQEKLASSGMDVALNYAYSLMDPSVRRVPVFETLYRHREEYLYFHTDHHWTQLGAYYAYLEFCKAKGLAPHSLSEYEKRSYPEFYGSFYFATNRAESLKENPDTVEVWLPIGNGEMSYTTQSGVTGKAPVISDASAMNPGSRYSCFIQGDNPYTEIENPAITDGSSIVMVKESYGNCFAPFLVDHYQHVYVIDYRYYTGNLSELIREKKVSDVLFLNNVMALGEKTSRQMLGIFTG